MGLKTKNYNIPNGPWEQVSDRVRQLFQQISTLDIPKMETSVAGVLSKDTDYDSATYGEITVTIGDGLVNDGDALAIDLTATPGLEFSGGDLQIKAGDGVDIATGSLIVDLTANSGLEFSTGDLQIKAGDGVDISTGTLVVDLAATPGLEFSGGDLTVKVKAAAGVLIDGDGLYVDDTVYVPYTGATANVDIGAHNLTTTGTVTADSIFLADDKTLVFGTNSDFTIYYDEADDGLHIKVLAATGDNVYLYKGSYVIRLEDDWGPWARGLTRLQEENGTALGEFGGKGTDGNTLNYMYIGRAWNDQILTIDFDNDIVSTVGKLGVHESSPGTMLQVTHATAGEAAHHDIFRMRDTFGGASVGYFKNLDWYDGTNTVAAIGAAYVAPNVNLHFHSFYSSGYKSEANILMTIMGTGDVGIGTSTPDEKLEVDGTILCTALLSTGHVDIIQPGASWMTVDSTTSYTTVMGMAIYDPGCTIFYEDGNALSFKKCSAANIRNHTGTGAITTLAITAGGNLELFGGDISCGAVQSNGVSTFGDGGSGDYTTFEADGTILFTGNATVWDDLRFPVSSVKRLGFSDPGWRQFKDSGGGSVGVYSLAFDKNIEEEVYFTVQLPHSYKEGSNITPHVHWSPADGDAGNVVWALEYTWANMNGTFGNTTTIIVTDAADGTVGKHQFVDFSAIDGTGKTISSILMCRLYRFSSSGADTYDDDAFLLEIDFHFEMDTIGSRQILIK